MKLNVWGKTDVGLKRDINQDTILVDGDLGLYVVADGMGGHKGGEVASAMAVETVQEVVGHSRKNMRRIGVKDLMVESFREASRRIHKKSTIENPELMGMGTTMVAALRHKDRLIIGNVGDSRAYLIRGDKLWQLTEDHSLINEQIKAGVISEEESAFMTGRNVITRSVGFERDVQVDVIEKEMVPGEMILMCSDGLSGMVSDRKIAQICSSYKKGKIVSECIKEAKLQGGDDNVSVLLLQILPDE